VLAVPIALLTLFMLWTIVRREEAAGNWHPALGSALALVTPLVLGAVGLGWYNWMRFGSMLETGLRYQMNTVDAALVMQEHRFELFSPLYVIQNVWNYFLAPPYVRPVFPFLTPIRGLRESIVAGIQIPHIYFP
jgi:hypothetical protein